jgi:hypothetical protein
MQSSVLPVDSPEAVRNRRDQTISHLRAVQARERFERRSARARRHIGFAVGALTALTAGLALYFEYRDRPNLENAAATLSQTTTVRAIEGRIAVIHGGKETGHALGPGARLEAGDAVRTTADSRAALTMQSRATVEVNPRTSLSLGSPERPRTEWLELELGHIYVNVPKLESGRSLSVRTPHATITVHGTRFSVLVAASTGGALQTTVDVREGAVQVEHDGQTTELGSGTVWSSESARARSSESVARPDRGTSMATSLAERGPGSQASPNSGRQAKAVTTSEMAAPRNTTEFTPPVTSTLSEENALLQQAMVASRNGDDRSAVAILDTLLGRFPHSILKENAQVERSRALKRLERANATGP